MHFPGRQDKYSSGLYGDFLLSVQLANQVSDFVVVVYKYGHDTHRLLKTLISIHF